MRRSVVTIHSSGLKGLAIESFFWLSTLLALMSHYFLQWFKLHDEEGNERQQPLSDDLTGEEGLLNAALFIEWIGKNQPGHEYKRKAEDLVSIMHVLNAF